VPALSGVKAIPWRLVLEVATVVVTRFRDDLPPAERRKLTALVRKSKGDPRRLSGPERRQVLELLKRVDAQRLGRDVSALVGANRLRRRLKRGSR
jgi:hypothetical protein